MDKLKMQTENIADKNFESAEEELVDYYGKNTVY